MITGITLEQFLAQDYNLALESARYNLNRIKSTSKFWDDRINEDDIIREAAKNSLEKTFNNYNPTRGAAPETLLTNIVRNEVVNELKKASKFLGVRGKLTEKQEKEYTFSEMVEQIPDDAMEDLKGKLRSAILKLEPIDQAILGFFLDDPRTFVEKSTKALNITANNVSVRKSRVLAQLPSLMRVSKADYRDMYRNTEYISFGFIQARSNNVAKRPYTNPVYPMFDLDSTVSKLYDALRAVMD